MMSYSLNKRPFVEDDEEQTVSPQQLNNPFSSLQVPFQQSFQPKRPMMQEISIKRPSVFPRIELSIDELIEMTGKTSFTVDDVRELMTQAVRINARKIREEFEEILVDKLNQQYNEFAINQRDYLSKQYGESNATYFL